ncbi:MAG: hypothetical protein SFV21_21880 [Rhodospirillaceae bacterium]|nr:hypothetical protein [Rhodospirillaceae bacterium]
MLRLSFTRVSNERHRFAYARADGSGESLDLETRSFLVHDFLHIAVECEARMTAGFLGQLAAGAHYADLSGPAAAQLMAAPPAKDQAERWLAEHIVGPLTPVALGRATPQAFLAGLADWSAAVGRPIPPWLDAGFVDRVLARYRSLAGRWRATPFGAVMDVQIEHL